MPDSMFPLLDRMLCFGTAPAVVASLLLLDAPLLLAALLLKWVPVTLAVVPELLVRSEGLPPGVAWVAAKGLLDEVLLLLGC